MPKNRELELKHKKGPFVSVGADATHLAPQHLTKSHKIKPNSILIGLELGFIIIIN